MTKAHQAFVKRRTRRGVAELKEQFDRFLRINSPFPNRLSRPNRSFQYHPSTPKEAFIEPRAHVIYDGVSMPVEESDSEFKKRYMGSWDVEPCTRQAPHICKVNGPCNGTPNDPELPMGRGCNSLWKTYDTPNPPLATELPMGTWADMSLSTRYPGKLRTTRLP